MSRSSSGAVRADDLAIEPLGDSVLLVRFAGGSAEKRWTRTLAAARAIDSAALDGVEEVSSAYESLAVFLREPATAEMEERIRAILGHAGSRMARGRTIEVPVCYDEEFVLDRERVETATGLPFQEVIRRHIRGKYRVACLGFMPGFPYLRGLPAELRVDRLSAPRTQVPAGSVAIAGMQTGIYPFTSPGGWNVLGRTPLKLFEPHHQPPALLAPGDQVRFRQISRAEFEG